MSLHKRPFARFSSSVGSKRPTARKQRLISFLPVNKYNSHPISVNHPAKFFQFRSILIELDGLRLKKDLDFTLSP